MTFEVEKIPGGGGAFFKPAEHMDAVAFLIEVRRFEAQRPGSFGPKDTIYADLTIFKDMDENGGHPHPNFLSNAIIQSTLLAVDLETLVGKATIAKLVQGKPSKPGNNPPWVWREVDASVQEKVVAYATARDEALAAAMAEAPEF